MLVSTANTVHRGGGEMADGRWQVGDERWVMADGWWQMGDDRWVIKDGRWKTPSSQPTTIPGCAMHDFCSTTVYKNFKLNPCYDTQTALHGGHILAFTCHHFTR
jgi:hypothetical protein